MRADVVQRLDRRGFLAAVAAAVAASPMTGFGQTLIQDTPSSGAGVDRRQWSDLVPQAPADTPEPQHAVAPMDWRRYLLSGERSIVMRRDGPVRRVRYCTADGKLDREGYAQACWMLRDVRAGKLFTMDPSLLDVLCGIQRWGEHNGRKSTIQLTSGFRSDETNARTEGAAKNSMHRYGRAADIVIEGFSSAVLGAMALAFNTDGGTGIYLDRGFVHVDTGRARSWVSRRKHGARK